MSRRRFMGRILKYWSRVEYTRANRGTTGIGINFELPANLDHALAHAGDTDAQPAWAGRVAVFRRGDAAAVVGDFQSDACGVVAKSYSSELASGMALNIGEALLGDPEKGGFDNLRKSAKTGRQFEGDVDTAAFAETVDIFLEGRDEAEIVEQRRVQQIRKGADFA